MIRVFRAESVGPSKAEVTLACECKPEHRIDFEITGPLDDLVTSRAIGMFARMKHVRLMAEQGCPDAKEEHTRPIRKQLEAELRTLNDAIDAAYWTFTRCKRGKPPVLVVPEAYARRREIEEQLRVLR